MKNTVGVVIPTFQRVSSTVQAVNSVLNQTHKVDQIVVVDDGSDSTIFDQLRNTLEGKRVQLIRIDPTRHPGRARNAGIELITTDWIAFLDSDDTWEEEKISKQLKHLHSSKLFAVCSNATIRGNNNKEEPYHSNCPKSIKLRNLLQNNWIVNSSVMIDRKLLNSVGGIAASYSVRGVEDYATWLRIASLTDWGYLCEPLVNYESDSIDSVRKSEDFAHTYSQTYAVIDFAEWQEAIYGHKNVGMRLISKLYPFALAIKKIRKA